MSIDFHFQVMITLNFYQLLKDKVKDIRILSTRVHIACSFD